MENTALFLDFDGVLCDSWPECYTSSWYAYYPLYCGERTDRTVLTHRQRFRELRPMVRNSEDNVVIQHIIRKGEPVSGQQSFDGICEDLGRKTLEEFRLCFYRARDYLITTYPAFWLGLNTLYPDLRGLLHKLADLPHAYILSTKRPDFIGEILGYNGIQWDPSKILEARGVGKLEIISNYIDKNGMQTAVFIDDQIDHIRTNSDDRITCFLADWGYVTPEVIQDHSVRHLDIRECCELVRRYMETG